MKRTQEEILARMEAVKQHDWLGVQQSDLAHYLDYEHVKRLELLVDGFTEEQWLAQRANTPDPIAQARDYIPFAWDKANNCRGISAGRSLDHLKAWLWLAGYDEMLPELEHYKHYGKKQLVACSVLLGVDWTMLDDGTWVNREDGPGIDEAERGALIIQAERTAAACDAVYKLRNGEPVTLALAEDKPA